MYVCVVNFMIRGPSIQFNFLVRAFFRSAGPYITV